MTRDEMIADAQSAKNAGDHELEMLIYQQLESMPGKEDTGNPFINAAYGAAARGNQAMAALNPWANKEKISAEQEWVKQHPGADVGSMIADMMITAPAGGAATMPARALLTGAIEGATNPGGLVERIQDAGYSVAGSGVGEKMADAASFLVKPFKKSVSPLVTALMQKADDMGMKLNAAQTTGNKALQYADSALDFIPSSSTAQQEFKDAQRRAWTKALLAQGHQSADIASPDVMGAMKDRISGVYEDVAGRNALKVDDVLRGDLASINDKYMRIIPTNQKRIVKSYLDDFGLIPGDKVINEQLSGSGKDVVKAGQKFTDTVIPANAQISGKAYQETRSMLDKQAKAFKNSDPATNEALKGIRGAIDSAMERSLKGGNIDDLAAWKQANKDWMVMKNVEGAIDPLTGEVSPANLLNAMKRKDANRVLYGKGDQELTDIARVGKQFITPKTGDSGTAQRQMMIKLLTGSGIGGLAATALYDPVTAAEAGTAALLGGVLLPKAAGAMMRKQGGYLTDGLADLGKEALPGITRQRVIEELMRNAGNQAVNQ